MTKERGRVVVVGPNPAMDLILEVPRFGIGEIWRAQRALHLAGGKPVNVARTLRRLGSDVCLVSPLGGHLGPRQAVIEACRDLGIDLRWCEIREETRTCVVVADASTGNSTVVNEQGPCLTPDEASSYERLMAETLRTGDLVLISGSLPPGLSPDFSMDVVQRAREADARVIVDTSGEALRRAIRAGPWAVKVNGDELLVVMGDASVEAAARSLAETVQHVVVTLGADGAIYAGPEGYYRVPAISIPVVNPTGAGDAFLAGLAAGLANTGCWPDALRLATAAAAMVCSRLEPDIGPSPLLDDLAAGVVIE